jgi:hypothetical protein
MKNAFTLIIVLFPTFLFSQGIYFKAGGNYHIPITTQGLNGLLLDKASSPSFGAPPSYSMLNIKDFSLAKGIGFSGVIGYKLNPTFSIQMEATYLKNNNEFESLNSGGDIVVSVNTFSFNTWAFNPGFLIGKQFNKNRLDLKGYIGLSVNSLQVENNGIYGLYYIYEFETSLGFNWGYGIEYSYDFNNNLSFFINAGFNFSTFTPKHATLIENHNDFQYLNTSDIEIDYVETIEGYTSDSSQPKQMLEYTIRNNSIYIGIGLKYSFK